MREPIYILPNNIQVMGEYAISKSNRYIRVRIKAHKLFFAKNKNGFMLVRKSRAVMTSVIGRALLLGEIVHHMDENPENDSPGNLEITNQSDHNKHHKIGFRHSESSKLKTSATMKKAYTPELIKKRQEHSQKRDRTPRGTFI